MEEGILSFCCSSPFLYIINNQHINSLIEIDKIVGRIIENRIGILHLKQTSTDIKHSLFRIKLLYTKSDGIYKMRLTTSRRPINKHRIKLGSIGMFCNRQSYRTRQLVTVTFYKGFKAHVRIQMGIQFLNSHIV